MKRPTVTSIKHPRSGHQTRDCCEILSPTNATVGTNMFQSKVAENVLPDCGRGSLQLELLL
eukprot:12140760-Prorocentrum_lima.AAC.1